MKLLSHSGAIFYYGLVFLWLGWNASLFYYTPWMIKSHSPRIHMGRTKIDGQQFTVAKNLLFPRWSHVKTYSLLVLMEVESPNKDTISYLHSYPYNIICTCEEYASHNRLLRMNWGILSGSNLRYSVGNVSTPEPRPTAQGRDLGPPKCTIVASYIDAGTTVIPKDMWLRWEVHVTPIWHWTDWFDRDVADIVYGVVDATLHVLFTGYKSSIP